jgi:hypothetical protein
MNTQTTLTDAMRRTSEAYAEGLAAVMKVIGDLPKDSGALQRHALEQWLGLARTNKDGFVAAVNQGFDIWERERGSHRSAATGPPRPRAGGAPDAGPGGADARRAGRVHAVSAGPTPAKPPGRGARAASR